MLIIIGSIGVAIYSLTPPRMRLLASVAAMSVVATSQHRPGARIVETFVPTDSRIQLPANEPKVSRAYAGVAR